jgi:hypothetical protein
VDKVEPVDQQLAAKALAAGLAAYPRFAAMKPYVERVALFRGSMLKVEFLDDKRVEGDPDNFAFEKVVVKKYRELGGT